MKIHQNTENLTSKLSGEDRQTFNHLISFKQKQTDLYIDFLFDFLMIIKKQYSGVVSRNQIPVQRCFKDDDEICYKNNH